jgi:hypothetical protein
MRPTTRKAVLGGALAAALASGGAGIAAAAGGPGTAGDDDEPALTGAELGRASRAALEASRAFGEGGRVTGTEGTGEEPYYEVDVTLTDGTQIDFDLDSSFTVVGMPEVEGQDDGTGAEDDSSEPGDD